MLHKCMSRRTHTSATDICHENEKEESMVEAHCSLTAQTSSKCIEKKKKYNFSLPAIRNSFFQKNSKK